jgi:hypothetical protein
MVEFASQLFREKAPINAEFQDKKAIHYPILAASTGPVAKASGNIGKTLFSFVDLGKKRTTVNDIFKLLNDQPLIDECYAQVLKLSNRPPDAVLELVADLFLELCTQFLPSPPIIPFVRSRLARLCDHQIARVRDKCTIAYIRFDCFVLLGQYPFETLPRDVALQKRGTLQLGVSLYEVMYWQRDLHPDLDIPVILLKTERQLMLKGAASSVGIFRLAGNAALLKTWTGRANGGDLGFLDDGDGDVNDVARLYKQWYRELAGGLISPELTQLVCEGKPPPEVLDRLEPLHRRVLAHLVRFLRVLLTEAENTKMGDENMGIVFAPTVMSTGFSRDPATLQLVPKMGVPFMVALFADMDVSDAGPESLPGP